MTEFTVQDIEDRIYEILCRAATGEEVILRHGDSRFIMLPVRPEDGPMFRTMMEDAKAQFREAFSYERMLDVSTMAELIASNFPSRPAAYWWIKAAALEAFEGQTPLQMLMDGRYEVLLRHVGNIMALEDRGDVEAGSLAGQEDVEAWLRDVIVPTYEAYKALSFERALEGLDRADFSGNDGASKPDGLANEMTEARIHPDTGKILRREMRPQTVSVGGLTRTVDVPGWYPDDDSDSIHSGADLEALDEVFRELRECGPEPLST